MMSFPVRRAVTAAALALATGSALLLPAAPASAAPVDGNVAAFGYGRVPDGSDCLVEPGPVNQNKDFSSTGPRRTASVARNFVSAAKGESARGRIENTSSAKGTAAGGALDRVVLTAEHLVRVNDVVAYDCGFGVLADTQSSSDFRISRNGRVRIDWDRGSAGQIEQIYVSRDGVMVVDRIRPDAHGHLVFNVVPGRYDLFVQFVTRANENDIPGGTVLTKRSDFRVVADYRR
ncbi:hypothetical protein [Nocardioides stalactiti]|uniref:hypothetical protein n=1 Tax=Nocardioides stalactiti TaxID=2755356 RepID=UPI0016049A20|nr:hypothetical protein [Nocardioides stalactiti]